VIDLPADTSGQQRDRLVDTDVEPRRDTLN
jgi:hypothetical protein